MINRAGKMIYLHVCLHEHDHTGLTDKPAKAHLEACYFICGTSKLFNYFANFIILSINMYEIRSFSNAKVMVQK